MYDETSISSGSSVILTSKRLCTSSRTLASSVVTKEIASPLVPKRPARPTLIYERRWLRYCPALLFSSFSLPFPALKLPPFSYVSPLCPLPISLSDEEVKSNPMQVHISRARHIVVDHNVHPLNVNSSSKDVGGHHDALLKIPEQLVASNPFFFFFFFLMKRRFRVERGS